MDRTNLATRWAGEFAVIVLGVLAALAVDSWREGQETELREQAYLTRLSEDLRADSAIFAERARGAQLQADELKALAEVVDQPSISASLEHVEKMTWILTIGRPDVRRVTFDELVSAADLGLISGGDLRAALSDYYGRTERQMLQYDSWEQQRLDTERHLQAVLPPEMYDFLNRSWRRSPELAPTTGVAAPSEASVAATWDLLRRDRQLQNMVRRGRLTLERSSSMMEGWSGRASGLLQMLAGHQMSSE